VVADAEAMANGKGPLAAGEDGVAARSEEDVVTSQDFIKFWGNFFFCFCFA
jgi:hypothetical protein